MTTVRDIMTEQVLTLGAEISLGDAIHALYTRDCGGAPVVTNDGKLCGMISELALLDVLFDATCRDLPVSDFMTTSVRVVSPSDSLEHAAHMFELYGIRRLPVVEGEQVVGIITRRDLIQYVLARGDSLANPLAKLLPGLATLGPRLPPEHPESTQGPHASMAT